MLSTYEIPQQILFGNCLPELTTRLSAIYSVRMKTVNVFSVSVSVLHLWLIQRSNVEIMLQYQHSSWEMLIPCENIQYCVSRTTFLVAGLAQPSQHRQSFGAKRTSDIIQPQVGRLAPSLPPSSPQSYTPQQQISDNNYNTPPLSISHLLSPALAGEQLLNIWTDG